jgi:spore coat protein A, manganese oxidase
MGTSRRTFLKRGVATCAAMNFPLRFAPGKVRGAGLVDGSTLTKYVDPLPIPPDWSSGRLAGQGLVMAESTHQFHQELGPSRTWGYGGASYLGPTIQAHRDVPVSFTAFNQLGAHVLEIDDALHGPNQFPAGFDQANPRVSVHLHGGYTEEHSDGHPELYNFRPGESRIYNYVYDQQAGTTWYHDHALGYTRLNVYAGLAGFHLIRDLAVESKLPHAGPFEVVLAIQDKLFAESGDGTNPIVYPYPWEPEFFGDVAVVNGKAWPYLDVSRGWYRFRLLNGSSSRFYNLELESDSGAVLPFIQLGTESGFLNVARSLTNLILAPGERVDVMVDFGGLAAGAKVRMKNLALPDYIVSPAEVEITEIMEFRINRQRGHSQGPPTNLRPSDPVVVPGPVAVTRNVLLTEILDEEDEPVMALLNARRWESSDFERPRVNTVEQWNIINLTADTHPIHLHLVQFLLAGRDVFDRDQYLLDQFGTLELEEADVIGELGVEPGLVNVSADGYVTGPGPVDLWEAGGWKDTIQAHPNMITRILVPFGGAAAPGVPFGQSHNFTGEYVWHCHILDHEDNEMMLRYQVVS